MGTLYMGSDLAQIDLGIPTAITGLFQGVLLFFLLACDYLIHYKIIWQASPNPAQASSSNTKQGAA
jgi:simple sugar transport system permease protein